MLIISCFLSIVLSLVLYDHLIEHPNSSLRVIANFMGRIKFSGGVLYFSKKVNFLLGLFILPFSIFGSISFIIYYKVFKGKIIEGDMFGRERASRWMDFCLVTSGVLSIVFGTISFYRVFIQGR